MLLDDWVAFSKSMDSLSKKKGEFDKRVVSLNKKTDALLNEADQSNLLEIDGNENDESYQGN
jgi:hypothetical protein